MKGIHRIMVVLLLNLLVAGATALPSVPRNDAGFLLVSPYTFYFHRGSYFDRLQLRSSETLLWYVFQSADQLPEQKPVFVFFNGGPYAATSSGLLSMYTSRYTLDVDAPRGGDRFIPNPVSWTGMGNLLYIDARTTGFSYSQMIDPEDDYQRYRQFDAQNYNIYVDAADFIRGLLFFFEVNPSLRDNPVCIVGESYGGIRATVMLHMLLNYEDYGNGQERYQDVALVQEIQAHYNEVFPDYAGQAVPPSVIAGQFGRQVLIQPALTYAYQREESGKIWEQPGSVIHQIAREEGLTFRPCTDASCDAYSNALSFVEEQAGRDPYIYPRANGWLLGYFGNAARLLRHSQQLQTITGVNVRDIHELYAGSRRDKAYKVLDTTQSAALRETAGPLDPTLRLARQRALLDRQSQLSDAGDLDYIFGKLTDWDRFFLDFNYDAISAQYWNIARELGYDIHYLSPRCGQMFLKNVAHVQTLITNARYDLVVYARALPQSLARHDDILESAVHDHDLETVANRNGRIVLTYRSGAFPDLPDLTTRVIRFPWYAESCHSVPLTQGIDFFQDVSGWMAAGPTPGQPETGGEK